MYLLWDGALDLEPMGRSIRWDRRSDGRTDLSLRSSISREPYPEVLVLHFQKTEDCPPMQIGAWVADAGAIDPAAVVIDLASVAARFSEIDARLAMLAARGREGWSGGSQAASLRLGLDDLRRYLFVPGHHRIADEARCFVAAGGKVRPMRSQSVWTVGGMSERDVRS